MNDEGPHFPGVQHGGRWRSPLQQEQERGAPERRPATTRCTITQATPPPGGTWADVVNATSAGGFVMGNPNAKVKLVEIGSLSCPHCKAFDDEGVPALIEKYVKPGKVSWEFRTYVIHGPIDVAADIVVRCNGAEELFPARARPCTRTRRCGSAKIEAVAAGQARRDPESADQPGVRAMASLAGLAGLGGRARRAAGQEQSMPQPTRR